MPQVSIFGDPHCAACLRVRDLFERETAALEACTLRFVDTNTHGRVQQCRSLSGGASTLPQVFLNGAHLATVSSVQELRERLAKLIDSSAARTEFPPPADAAVVKISAEIAVAPQLTREQLAGLQRIGIRSIVSVIHGDEPEADDGLCEASFAAGLAFYSVPPPQAPHNPTGMLDGKAWRRLLAAVDAESAAANQAAESESLAEPPPQLGAISDFLLDGGLLAPVAGRREPASGMPRGGIDHSGADISGVRASVGASGRRQSDSAWADEHTSASSSISLLSSLSIDSVGLQTPMTLCVRNNGDSDIVSLDATTGPRADESIRCCRGPGVPGSIPEYSPTVVLHRDSNHSDSERHRCHGNSGAQSEPPPAAYGDTRADTSLDRTTPASVTTRSRSSAGPASHGAASGAGLPGQAESNLPVAQTDLSSHRGTGSLRASCVGTASGNVNEMITTVTSHAYPTGSHDRLTCVSDSSLLLQPPMDSDSSPLEVQGSGDASYCLVPQAALASTCPIDIAARVISGLRCCAALVLARHESPSAHLTAPASPSTRPRASSAANDSPARTASGSASSDGAFSFIDPPTTAAGGSHHAAAAGVHAAGAAGARCGRPPPHRRGPRYLGCGGAATHFPSSRLRPLVQHDSAAGEAAPLPAAAAASVAGSHGRRASYASSASGGTDGYSAGGTATPPPVRCPNSSPAWVVRCETVAEAPEEDGGAAAPGSGHWGLGAPALPDATASAPREMQSIAAVERLPPLLARKQPILRDADADVASPAATATSDTASAAPRRPIASQHLAAFAAPGRRRVSTSSDGSASFASSDDSSTDGGSVRAWAAADEDELGGRNPTEVAYSVAWARAVLATVRWSASPECAKRAPPDSCPPPLSLPRSSPTAPSQLSSRAQQAPPHAAWPSSTRLCSESRSRRPSSSSSPPRSPRGRSSSGCAPWATASTSTRTSQSLSTASSPPPPSDASTSARSRVECSRGASRRGRIRVQLPASSAPGGRGGAAAAEQPPRQQERESQVPSVPATQQSLAAAWPPRPRRRP